MLSILNTIACPAVNVFILLSGYFLCDNTKKLGFSKIVDLLLQLLVFHIIYIGFNWLEKGEDITAKWVFESLLPNDYFVSIYIPVYLLSPYVNKFLKIISKEEANHFYMMIILFFSVIPALLDVYKEFLHVNLSLNNPLGHFGSGLGQTFVQFLLMYLIGAYIRQYDVPKLLSKQKNVIALLLINIVVILPFVSYESIQNTDFMDRAFLAYHNPLLISESVLLFLLFRNMKFNSKIVNFLAKSAFTCYIIGNVIISKLFNWDYLLASPILMLGYLLAFVIIAYLISVVYFTVYTRIIKPLIMFDR